MIQIEILDLNLTTEEVKVDEAVWKWLRKDPSAEVKVSVARRHFRGARETFVQLVKVHALGLLKMTHINSGRVRRRLEASRCHCCLSFEHMATGVLSLVGFALNKP